MQIYSVNPVLLNSLQSRRSPNYNCDQPSLCTGGFYWQQGGLPSAALVRGIWGRMDMGGGILKYPPGKGMLPIFMSLSSPPHHIVAIFALLVATIVQN